MHGSLAELHIEELGLFVDVDGTLLDIAPRPDAAAATPGLIDALDGAFHALGGALALVSGRRIEDVDRLFAPLRLPASGVHGVQLRRARDADIEDRASVEFPEPLRAAIQRVAARHAGALVEDKRHALALHWRACPQAGTEIHREIRAALAAADDRRLTLLSGHFVFEIKAAAFTKADAVEAFMAAPPFAGRKPLFIGDDTTDLAGFAAARAHGGLALSVGRAMPGAQACIPSPREVRAWLAALAGRTSRRLSA